MSSLRDTDKNDGGPDAYVCKKVHNICKLIDSNEDYPKEWAEEIMSVYNGLI